MQQGAFSAGKMRRIVLYVTTFLLLLPLFSSLLSIFISSTTHAAEPAQWAAKGTIVYKGKTYVVKGKVSENTISQYIVPGTPICNTGSAEIPYEYIEAAPNINTAKYRTVNPDKKDATGRPTCEEFPSVDLTLTGNSRSLFFRDKDSVFDYAKQFEFKKTGAAGPNGSEIFVRGGEQGSACPDIIVKDGGKWLFFPMGSTSYVEEREPRHGNYAVSERYSFYLNNPGYTQACKVASSELATVFQLAEFNVDSVTTDDDDYDSCQMGGIPKIIEWSKLPNLDDEADFEVVRSSGEWNWNNKDYVTKCSENPSDAIYEFVRVRNKIIDYKSDFKPEIGDDAYTITNGVSDVIPQAVPPPTQVNPPPGGQGSQSKTSCAIDGIGWILCPVVTFLANITDAAYSVVASLLTVSPLLTTGGSQGIFDAWSVMRNFANVSFVIAFLIIIFSQITSVGITNYGIKKMLPRLIIAAVLVNASYWICAIAVDLSNVLGGSLNDLLLGVRDGLPLPNEGVFSAGKGWAGFVGPLIAGGLVTGIAFFVGLSVLLPMLVVVLATIITVFLALILRQAFIIILIVVSPLAFVAYLLPNTEALFKKWRSVFQTLLVIYPIVAIIFGGSALASKVIMMSAGDHDYSMAIQIAGAAAAVIPLVAAPALMKVINGVANRFGLPNVGVKLGGLRKGAEGVRDRQKARQQIRALDGNKFSQIRSLGRHTRQAKRDAMSANIQSEQKRAQSAYVAQQVQSDSAFQNRLAGGQKLGPNAGPAAMNRALANAINVQAQIEADEVKAASAVIENAKLDMAGVRALANGGTSGNLDATQSIALRKAAMQQMVNSNDIKGINDMVDSSRGWTNTEAGAKDGGDKLRKSLADSLGSSGSRPAYIGQGALAAIRNGSNTSSATELIEKAVAANAYSPEKIAKADLDELNAVAQVVNTSTNIAPQDAANIMANARTALTDPQLRRTMSKNLGNAQHIQNGTAPPPLR